MLKDLLKSVVKMSSSSELSQVKRLTSGLDVSNRNLNMNGGIDFQEELNTTLKTLNGSILLMNDFRLMTL